MTRPEDRVLKGQAAASWLATNGAVSVTRPEDRVLKDAYAGTVVEELLGFRDQTRG